MLSTGLTALDGLMGGLGESDLIVLAGRPSCGKSTLTRQIIEHVALHQHVPAGVFVASEPASQWRGRLMLSITGLTELDIALDRLSDSQRRRVAALQGEIDTSIHIDDRCGLSVDELGARALEMKQHQNIGLIAVDYLQIVGRHLLSEDRADHANTVHELKTLARELRVPILVLSMLNRSVDQRADKRPVLADLEEGVSCAALEHVDVALLMYRDELYDPHSTAKGRTEITVGQQRSGPLGQIALRFQDHRYIAD